MKKILSLIAAACLCASVGAVENATVKITKKDGKTETRVEKLREISKGVMRLEIPIDAIPRDVRDIEITPDDGFVKKGSKGYFVLGDGRSGDFSVADGKLLERRNPMPLYGVKVGDKAFLAIVKGLKYEWTMSVIAEKGDYKIGQIFNIEGIEFDPYEPLIVDFYNLEGADANYSKMGRIYRDYQLARGEVKPLRERVKNNPQLAYTADTMFVRVKHGSKPIVKSIEHQTLENEPKIGVGHTFDNFMDIMKDLKKLGVGKLEVCTVGWNAGGFDGRFPDLFPVPEEFGGEKKLREAINLAHSLDYQIICHVCNTDFYRIASRFDDANLAKHPDGKLRPCAHMAGGRAYKPCFQCVADRIVPEDYKRLTELGLKGTHHIDVTSCITPYPCHDPMHPCNRQQTADYQNKVGELAHKYFGGFGSEGPCDHVAKTLDYALYVWAYPNWVGRANPLVNKLLPIWQIAYHGIILSNPYYATIDYNVPGKRWGSPYDYFMDPKIRRLKLYELNGRPTYYFISYKPDQLKLIKEAYDEYQGVKHLQYEFMDSHSEIAPDVFLTEFSDGSRIVTNYTDKDFSYDGKTVKAKDYLLINPSFLQKVKNFFK